MTLVTWREQRWLKDHFILLLELHILCTTVKPPGQQSSPFKPTISSVVGRVGRFILDVGRSIVVPRRRAPVACFDCTSRSLYGDSPTGAAVEWDLHRGRIWLLRIVPTQAYTYTYKGDKKAKVAGGLRLYTNSINVATLTT